MVYDQELLTGKEASSFVAEHQPTPQVVARLHHEILRCLAERIHPYRRVENTDSTIQTSYLEKIADRLELAKKAAPEIFDPLLKSDTVVINGRPYRNIGELLGFFAKPEVSELLEPKCHCLVMGDSNTENVMIGSPDALLSAMDADDLEFTYDDIGVRFLDPRAIGYQTVGAETVDDPMYDNKPVHNSLGHYDTIHGEFFGLDFKLVDGVPHIDLKADPNDPYRFPYQDMERHFQYVMEGWDVSGEEFQRDDPNWLLRFTFMMGTHFAAMPPFHFKRGPDGTVPEDPEVQKRAIAIYCEGLQWLNRAYDMLTGNRQELYGVPVAPIQGVPLRQSGAAERLL